jgi:hypothetical protein
MLETDTLPKFLRAVCHVPLPRATVTLSEVICTPVADVPPEGVLVELVPFEELATS